MKLKMNELVMEKANELGKMISECKERIEAAEAMDRLNNDKEASDLIKQYNDNRKYATEKLKGKTPTPEEINKLKDYIQSEFDKISKNPIIADYIDKSKGFDSLIDKVNSVLSYYITGEEKQQTGCSGSCGGCGGC